MRKLFLAICLLASLNIFAGKYKIIPLPAQITDGKGEFVLTSETNFYVKGDNVTSVAQFFSDKLAKSTGFNIAIGTKKNRNSIQLIINKKIKGEEAYTLAVTSQGVTAQASTPRGLFYAMQTFMQLLPPQVENPDKVTGIKWEAPAVTIQDKPRFSYRGAHIDVCRHYFPIDMMKHHIDVLSLFKINNIHWHLTEDQGWRMEIKKYPKLTTEGSVRANTVLGRNSTVTDGTPHGGFYTQAECREIVEYARQRYITVIPEIDMPGHMLGALTAYPELGCTGGPYHVEGRWGVFDDILCAGKEKTFQFVEDVLTEVMDVFPAEYIHIGGDEAPRTRWKACPLCQQRIADEGLVEKDGQSPEARLQGYFTKRVEKFINDHGRKLIGWDELLESDVNPSATIMSWRGTKGGLEASKKGHDVIMTPVGYCYFDYYQTDNTTWGEPLSIGGNLPVEKTYSFNPAPPTLSPEAQSHIIGVQGNLWTEYIAYHTQAEYHVLPRMGALAEVQWMEPARKDFSSFLERSQSLLRWYKHYGWTYAPHIYR